MIGRRRLASLLVALILALASIARGGESVPERYGLASAAPLDLALFVEETAGVDRFSAPAGEMVRSGVAIPEVAHVVDAERLYLLRRDEDGEWTVEVPMQARITSRWGGPVHETALPAKWVLLDFPASVSANSRMKLRLRYDSDGSRGTWQSGLPDNARLVSDLGDHLRIDTGKVRFEIRKDRFGVFEGMHALDTRGEEPVWTAFAVGNPLEIALTDGDRTKFLASRLAPAGIAIEENGPLAGVIAVSGRFGASDGRPLLEGWIGYTLRIHVYAQSSFVRTFFTLENNGFYGLDADWSVKDNYPKWLYFDSLSIGLSGDFGDEREVAADVIRAVLEPEGPTGIRLLQDHRITSVPETLSDESRNFFYDVIVEGGDNHHRGNRSNGVFRIDDGGRGVTACVRHFWQNYPKAMSFRDRTLSIELWPSEGVWPNNAIGRRAGTYQFEGGRHKTHEIGIDFAPGGVDDIAGFAERLGSPLFARADAAAVSGSGALGFVAPGGVPAGNPATAAAMRRFERMHEAFVDVRRAESQPLDPAHDPRVPPISLVTQRETRGNALRANPYDMDLYGWFSFGDLPHAEGFSSLHYDWPLGMLLQYLRHDGKREFLDIAEEMVRHRYDIDQYHNRENEHSNWMYFNGFARTDSGWHGDLTRGGEAGRSERPPHPNYTWLAGLVLHHALTGDMRSIEAARENADALLEYYRLALGIDEKRVPIERYHQVRTAALAVSNLLDYFDFTGEPKYRDMAETIFRNQIRHTEELHGNGGFFMAEGEQHLFNMVLLLEPLRKLHMITGDPEVLALMTRVAGRLKAIYTSTSGYVQLGRYKPLQIPMEWVPGRFAGSQIPYGFFTADAFAYLWLETKQPGFMEFARRLFHDSVTYFQAGEAKLVPEDFQSPVTYSPTKYPGSETQVNAWVLRGHQVYLFAEWLAGRDNPEGFRFKHDDFRRLVGAAGIAKPTVTPARPSRARGGRIAPPIRHVSAPDGHTLVVEFSAPVDRAGATRFDRYHLTPELAVHEATLDDTGTRVTLRTGPIEHSRRYELEILGGGETARRPFFRDLIADDSGPAFSVLSGDWGRTTTDLDALDRTTRFARPGGAVATAQWTIPVPATGYYEVYVRWPEAPLEREVARIAPYRIRYDGGVNEPRVNQRVRAGRWVRIATLPFRKEHGAVIQLTTDGADGTVLADGVRLVFTQL